MQRIHLLSQEVLSRLKQRARNTKRELKIPHHEALEITAKAVGFDNWHQIAEAAALCKPLEDAFKDGFLLAFDPSETPSIDDDKSPITWQPYAFDLLRDQLFAHYSKIPDEEDPQGRPISETLAPDDLREFFEDDWGSLYFFSVRDPQYALELDELLDTVRKISFWPPRLVFKKGLLADTCGDVALNDDGEVVGVRF